MAYRGYFALDGTELANSSRVVSHLGQSVPTSDAEVFGPQAADCSLTEHPEYPGLFVIPDDSVEVRPGLWSPPAGSRRYDSGLFSMDGTCWGPASMCGCSGPEVDYDDTWTGLREFLGDINYRIELAPWYTTQLPESGEFAGIWIFKVDGLGPTPVERTITQAVGSGGVAGAHRDKPRAIMFEALLIGCSHAGLEYGLDWLACQLRATTTDTRSVLRFLQASPALSGVDPASLLRDVHGVVLTVEPTVTEEINGEGLPNQQATMYRVTWEMATVSPYAYLPSVTIPVDWDAITRQPITWVHAAECQKPETCVDMPVLFSTTCVPESINLRTTPPPVCGGCLPVGEIDKYVFQVPTMEYAFRCRETAVSMTLTNLSDSPLTLQAFWRECGSDVRCEDDRWPLQVAGLRGGAKLILDGITGQYWAYHDERMRRPWGIVGTPNGAPWRPPVIDRRTCWEFIVQAASTAEFSVELTAADRAA